MANAKRRRNQATTDDDFDMLLSDALALLLKPGHITAGASWSFRVENNLLIITRSVAVASTPDPES